MKQCPCCGQWVMRWPLTRVQACTGPISILKRLLNIADISTQENFVIKQDELSLSWRYTNWKSNKLCEDQNAKVVIGSLRKRSDGKRNQDIDFDWRANCYMKCLKLNKNYNYSLTGGIMSKSFCKQSWDAGIDDAFPFCGHQDTFEHGYVACPSTDKFRRNIPNDVFQSIVWYFFNAQNVTRCKWNQIRNPA